MSLPSPQSTQKFSIREAARFLNISTKTLRRWEKQGILVAERTPGNQRRYPLSQLENFSPKPLPRTPISPSPLLTSDFSPFRLSKFQKGLIFSSILLGITAASLLAINQAGTNILPLDQVVASIREFITFGETAENNREYNPVQLPPGLVLAESTSAKDLLFHISVPTLIDSTATVSGDLTAPNIIYGIRTGPGINVSLGQTPTVSNTGVLSFQGQTGTVNLTAGSGISISGTTIASTVSSGNAFKTIAVSGQNDVTAGSSGDTLTFAGGSGIGLTTSSSDKKVTIGVSTITPTLGGTGLTTYTTGDILYASAANTLSKLAIGSSNQILAVSGGIPSWADNSSGGWTSASDNLYPTTTSDRIIIGGNTSTVHQLEVSGAITGKSLVSFNETGDQYILTASASGVEKFSITNAGGISLGGSVGSGSLCLLGGATASWGSCSDTASPNYWQLGTGTLAPGNLTQSTIFGDTATSSASLRALIGGSITGGQASLIVNQFESQDIFSASASGTTRFVIAQDGDLTLAGGNVITASSLDTLTSSTTLGVSATAFNLGNGSAATIGTLSDDNLTIAPNGSGILILDPTGAGSVSIGSVDITSISLTTDASARDDITLTGGITGTTTLDVQGTSIGLNYDASVNNVLSFGTGPGAATDDLYWGNSKVCESTDSTCGWATTSQLTNYWQLGTGTLAPGNLTQSTIFGDPATASASLRALVGGSITSGQASLIVNQFESQDIFSASASGTTKFTIASDGSFTIPAQTAASTITSTQTTGNALSMANASSSQTDDTLVNVSQTGVTTGYTGNLVNINSSSTTGAAKFLNLAADSSTVGTLLNLSGNALTSGAGIAVGSTSTGLTGSLLSLTSGSTAAVTNGIFYLSATGAHSGAAAKITTAATAGTGLSIADSSSSQTTTTLLDIAQTGVTTGYTGNVVNFSGTATTGSGFNIVNITSNAINGTGTGLNVNSSTTGALTSGLERINASAAHTGTAWQLLSGTQTGGAGSINLSAVTTGTGLNINTSNNTWTTGSLLYANSTATSLTTGLLGNFSWEPSTVATASGDLVRINIGAHGDTTGNLFNITSSGSNLFSVSETAITNTLPTSFTAAGDVSFAYDLLFTNQTASYLKSNAPLYIQAGEIFESNNLTAQLYNSGRFIIDTTPTGGMTLSSNISAASLQGIFQISGQATGKALAILDETGDQNILVASASGIGIFTLDRTGGITLSGAATTAINISNTSVTTDISLQNGETITNNSDGQIDFGITGGSELSLSATALFPSTDSGLDLGSSSNQFADLYLDGGGINLDNATDIDIDNSVASVFTISEGTNNFLAIATDTDALSFGNATTNPAFSFLGTGEVLIGTGSASLKFTVSDQFAATAAAMIENSYNGDDADGLVVKLGYTGVGAASNRFIAFLNGMGVTVGRIEATTALGVAYQTDGIDFAEYYTKAHGEPFTEGDIVSLSHNAAVKSSQGYDTKAIGIVSTSPGFKGGQDGPDKVLVGLVGQVPVNLASFAPPIKKGDFLTSSSEPGRATRAPRPGHVIGQALEDWNPGSSTRQVMVHISPSWADSYDYFAFDDSGNVTIKGNLSAQNLQLVGEEIINLKSSIINLETQVASLSAQLTSLPLTANSYQLPADPNWTLATASGQLVSSSPIMAPGAAFTGQVSIGTLIFDDLTSDIRSATGLLSLNSGSVILDESGNLKITGSLTADKINISGSSLGTATISAGLTETIIDTTAVSTTSAIFATPIDTPVPVAASATEPGKFVLRIPTPLSTSLKVSWWVVN